MKTLLGTKIVMLYWRNYVKSGCAIAGFHCTSVVMSSSTTKISNDWGLLPVMFSCLLTLFVKSWLIMWLLFYVKNIRTRFVSFFFFFAVAFQLAVIVRQFRQLSS